MPLWEFLSALSIVQYGRWWPWYQHNVLWYRPVYLLLTKAYIFYQRDALLAGISYGSVSVCLSVCLSQTGTVSKRLNASGSFWRRGLYTAF